MSEDAKKTEKNGELMENEPLAEYGAREELREMRDRITTFLPQVGKVGKTAALALAQVALRYGLDPFSGEIWAVPQAGNTYSIMVGIEGLRKLGRRQAQAMGGTYAPPRFRPPTPEEMGGFVAAKGDLAVACDIVLLTPASFHLFQMTGDFMVSTGIGVFEAGEKSRMPRAQVVRKRAEADALKRAFDLGVFTAHADLWDIPLVADEGDGFEAPPQVRALSQEPTEEAFLDRVIEAEPHYKHRQHVRNTIAKLGMVWAPESEQGLYEALVQHGANAEATARTERETALPVQPEHRDSRMFK